MWHTSERRVLKMTDCWPEGGAVWQLPCAGLALSAVLGFFTTPQSAFPAVPASITIAALVGLATASNRVERSALLCVAIANGAVGMVASGAAGQSEASVFVPGAVAAVAVAASLLGVRVNRRTLWRAAGS